MQKKLVFSDYFQKDGTLDTTKWLLEEGGHGWGNHEAQFYTKRLRNAEVKNGALHITARKENYQNCHYTSAKVTTFSKFSLQYGTIRVRAKMPKGNGTWPAIWLLSDGFKTKKIPWPDCGEIDLVEHVGHNPHQIHFSLHSKSGSFHEGTQKTYVTKLDDAQDTFHTYEMRWTPQAIHYYIDQQLHQSFYKKASDGIDEWPFDQPFYLIMNIAIGGIWGGLIDDKIFPTTMIIDSVEMFEY